MGIGGRVLRQCDTQATSCLLVVGQSPGAVEDAQGQIFVGKSGAILTKWYLKYLPTSVDAWATNAVKCIPPWKKEPTKSQVGSCLRWLYDDLQTLQRRYSRVTVLCLGRSAVMAMLGVGKLKTALGMQGRLVALLGKPRKVPRKMADLPVYQLPDKYRTFTLQTPVPVYSTQHPAYLMRNPKPAVAAGIKDHLCLCRDSMVGAVEDSLVVHRLTPAEFECLLKSRIGGVVSLDIETYGIRPGVKQTQFHPKMSERLDGVPIGQQIVSLSMALDPTYGNPDVKTTAFFIRDFPDMPLRLLSVAIENGYDLLGMNILFDLTYLMAAYRELSRLLTRATTLIDIGVLAFRENPDRSERSLKALSPLMLRLATAAYEPKGTQYGDDVALLEYNRQDSVNPIALLATLMRRMMELGLPVHPWKTIEFDSNVLHTLLHMQMVGVTMDAGKVRQRLGVWQKRATVLADGSERLRGVQVMGEGSQASVAAVFERAVSEAPTDVEWELTKKTGKLGTGKANLRRAVTFASSRGTVRQARVLWHYRTASKLVSSYLRPLSELMDGSDVGPCTLYPTWYAVPSRVEAADDEGGTRQGRTTCRRPALQTSPSEIKAALCSRFERGELWSFDYSQLELRLLALESGDEALMDVYLHDGDVHQTTLDFVAKRHVLKSEPHYDRERRKAKFTNFGVVYDIEGKGLQENWWKNGGIRATIAEAEEFIRGFKLRYRRIVELHNRLRDEVERTGRLALPETGHWLSFAKPSLSPDKAIYNFRTQGMAALLCLVAQEDVIAFVTGGGFGVSPLNIYDAIHVDVMDAKTSDYVRKSVVERMEHNWYIDMLYKHFGREVPFKVDAKRLWP